MTIALAVQVMDGLVLAADSAASISMGDGLSPNVYTNATKIVNLRKGLPLGVVFYGTGALGNASMATLAKDLRQRFTGHDGHPEWRLKNDNWTVHGAAERVRQFFHDEHFACNGDASQVAGVVGIMVGGQSPDKHLSELYEITISPDGHCHGPEPEHDGTLAGIVPRGQPEAIIRLAWGMGLEIDRVLTEDLGVAEADVESVLSTLRRRLARPLVHSAMPLPDAVDLAEFLVETTKQWERFNPGAPTVGGPTEIAVISRHEGFQWVRRRDHRASDHATGDG